MKRPKEIMGVILSYVINKCLVFDPVPGTELQTPLAFLREESGKVSRYVNEEFSGAPEGRSVARRTQKG